VLGEAKVMRWCQGLTRYGLNIAVGSQCLLTTLRTFPFSQGLEWEYGNPVESKHFGSPK